MDLRKLLFGAALLGLLVLPGCADLTGGGATLTEAEAQQAYQAAFSNLDALDSVEAVGIDTSAFGTPEGSDDEQELFSYEMKVRPAEAAFLVSVSISPELLEDSGGDGTSSAILQNLVFGQEIRDDGVAYLVTPNLEGELRLRRDHVPEETSFDSFDDLDRQLFPGAGGDGGVDPATDTSVGPDFGLAGLNEQGDVIVVESVEEVIHKGRKAWRISFTVDNATYSAQGEAIIYDDPRLPARLEVTIQPAANASSEDHPLFELDSVRVVAVFTYDDEVVVDLPEAERAPFFLSRNEQDNGSTITGTVSPDHQQEVPLSEVRLDVGEKRDTSFGGFGDTSDPEVYFQMVASQGEANNDEFRVVYDDVNEDGLLSGDDTYLVEVNNQSRQGNVSVHFFDTWAMKYEFQPGFGAVAGLVAMLAGVGAVAVKRRLGKQE